MSLETRSLRFSTDRSVELHCLVWSKIDSAEDEPDTPLVLLHGGGANAHWWDHIAPRFRTDRTVYALDFRGHGDSEHPREREVGAFNFDLEALLGWLGREDVHLVGHSLGAAVALDHASRFPATRSITLIDPARGGTPGSGRRARLALSLRRTYSSRAEAIDRFRFLPESSHASEELRAYIARHSIREEPDGRFGYKFDPAWFGLPSRPRPDPDRIACPTLVIRGAESGLLSTEAAEALVQALHDGRLEEIANAGHHVFLDQPEQTCARIREFLAGDRRSSFRRTFDPA
jgi:pimeloyl-ACP methyl ester carboxylesterase